MIYQKKIFQVAVLLLLIALPLFATLDKLAIILWDEARLAINALEMYRTGFSPVTTYHLEPETWNTKPPLLIWLQVLFFHMFGVNEIAFRLPSVLAALATSIMIYLFCLKQLKKPWVGIMAVVILLTSEGYTAYHHSARSGDYDALLTFFVTTYVLSFFRYVETGKVKYIFAVFIAAALAVLTKSVAGLLMLPGVFMYALYRKKVLNTLKRPAFYIGLLVFCILVVGYYLTREYYQPGYWHWVNINELGGRYIEVGLNTNEYSNNPFFYIETLITRNFSNWYWLLPIAVVAGLLIKHRSLKEPVRYFIILSVIFLLIISKATGRNPWYDMPVYPLLSIIVAIGISIAYDTLSAWEGWEKTFSMNALPLLLVFYLMITPYVTTILRVLYAERFNWVEGNSAATDYFKEILHGHEQLNNFKVFRQEEYEGNLEWYISVLNMKGHNIDSVVLTKETINYMDSVNKIVAHPGYFHDTIAENHYLQAYTSLENVKNEVRNNFDIGDTVVAYQELTRSFIVQNYHVSYLYLDKGVITYILDSTKNRGL